MKNRNKGAALFITLMFLFLLSLIVAAVLLTTYNYISICESQIRRQRALVSAEAGIHYAYWQLRTNLDSFTTAHYSELTADSIVPGGDGLTVKVWVEGPVSERLTVKSKVAY